MENRNLSHESTDKPQILRESEFYGGCIRVKISVKNTSGLAILDAALELESDERILHFDRCEPEEYQEKKGKIILGNINPHNDTTIAFYLDPLICAKEGTDINCRVNFKYADGTLDTVYMEKLKVQVVCPIFRTEHDINIGRLKELIKELHSQDSKVYTIPKRVDITECLKICRNVIQQHDVRHIKTFKTTDDTTYECWYFGKTKVTKKDLVIKCAIRKDTERKDTESIEIFVSGDDPKDITGLLAEIGRNLTKEFEKLGNVQPVFKVVVKNSMIKGSNLLSFCDLNGICGGNVVIEDSFVEGTNVASGIQEDKEKAWREEQKRLEDARNREKQREADLLRKAQDVQRQKEKDRIQKEQQEKAQRERKTQERGDFTARKEPEGTPWKGFFTVALVLGMLALGYWALEPFGSDSPQLLKSTPSPTATIIQTPKLTPTIIQTPKITPTASPVPIVAQASEQQSITNSIGMEFVQIPAGEFDMGSPANEKDRFSNEGTVHLVKISNAFYMGKYEVTQKQWRDVMGSSHSYFKGDNLPVESVSWNDVQDFIKKLNEKEGGNKYRLPSEAEWEYSARAGTTTRFSFGNDDSILGDYAWYDANSGSKTHDVGQKKPNPWGLYDMHGNVWKWVQDIYHDSYSGAPIDGSAWEGSGSPRVFRGGDWHRHAGGCRSAARSYGVPDARGTDLGFRLLRIL